MRPKKLLSLLLCLAMMLSLMSVDAFAADGVRYKAGTWEGSATVTAEEGNPDEWEQTSYPITVDVTVDDSGKIAKVAYGSNAQIPSESKSYANRAMTNGRGSISGLSTQIIEKQGVDGIDVVTGATRSSSAIVTAVKDALTKAVDTTPSQPEAPEYTYGYAALTWTEYWENEGVYNATNTSSRPDIDAHNETDMGGFDAVSRATTNHGVARGAFQCSSVFETTDGTSIAVAYWTGSSTFVSSDGKTGTYTKGAISYDGKDYTMKDYRLTGTRYVPVAVKTADLDAFKASYQFAANGDTLYVGQQGSTAEGNIVPYSAVAAVDAGTNGLKTVSKNADGSFSFSKAQSGSGSGLEGAALKTADVTPNLRSGKDVGSFGEFIRLDLNGNYGDLGASMQSVIWTYYGSDSTYSNALRTFGTKFAADNWMHSKMGIQLGLTDSDRCALPAGTDGTGYWAVTVRALGYADYTYKFQATSDNIAVPSYATDDARSSLSALVEAAGQLDSRLYTEDSWNYLQTELSESKDMLTWTYLYEATVNEQATHLRAAMDALQGASGYVLMNIPYADFYAAETGTNTTQVDAFSSATKNKTRTGTLAGGSYHVNADGSDITGVTFPVYVSDLSVLEGKTAVYDESKVSITVTNRGSTTTTDYVGKDALFESASYSYYILSEVPTYYKELTVAEDGTFTFDKVHGDASVLNGASAELTTESSYGDYELSVSGLPETVHTVYGVVIQTAEGDGYGLRHVENIWRQTELAFCTGFTTSVHGCPTSSAHYVGIMGQHISSITYYTDAGIYVIPMNSLYVPVTVKTDITISDGKSGDSSVDFRAVLPDDFDADYSVAGIAQIAAEDGKLSYIGAKPGQYTLTVTDKSGKYAAQSASFLLSTDTVHAIFNGDSKSPALVAAEGISAESFADFLKNISSVTVNGKDYSASGRGAVRIIKEDGSIDLTAAASNAPIFADNGAYAIVVHAAGYPDVAFTLTIGEQPTDPADPGTTDPSNPGTSEPTTPGTSDSGTCSQPQNPGVKTGDSDSLLLAMALLLTSGAAFAVLTLRRRKSC